MINFFCFDCKNKNFHENITVLAGLQTAGPALQTRMSVTE
uniref:Uncharacterized protein n=1 Tax=Anguilla anguilla TaxID=7936 RepID=A0A0E9U2P1_ANGAN